MPMPTPSTSDPSDHPLTVDVVVTDPAWIARRDQVLRDLQKSALWMYGGSATVAEAARRHGELS